MIRVESLSSLAVWKGKGKKKHRHWKKVGAYIGIVNESSWPHLRILQVDHALPTTELQLVVGLHWKCLTTPLEAPCVGLISWCSPSNKGIQERKKRKRVWEVQPTCTARLCWSGQQFVGRSTFAQRLSKFPPPTKAIFSGMSHFKPKFVGHCVMSSDRSSIGPSDVIPPFKWCRLSTATYILEGTVL